jgi:hypothetical protein
MAVALRRIRRGDFAREFIREMKTGRRYTKWLKPPGNTRSSLLGAGFAA